MQQQQQQQQQGGGGGGGGRGRRSGGCLCLQGCSRHVFQEDNVRFVLHAVFMIAFCLIGAIIFMQLEAGKEQKERARYSNQLDSFIADNPTVNVSQLNALLSAHALASVGGFLNTSRPRWDFAGSLYFVGTLVSTIGFGMATPRTQAGRALSILYGLVGCSGFILFFNLFLERVITLTTRVMRCVSTCWHRRRQRRSSDGWSQQHNDVASIESAGGTLDSESRSWQSGGGGSGSSYDESWKPSVYLVMLVLFLAVVILGCLSSLLYSWAEQWTFGEAIYFSFCLFATIGFGDYVPLQHSAYTYTNIYRACNALIFVIGCGCMYSLFNVVSIVIKQLLNVCIRWIESGCKRLALVLARPAAVGTGQRRSKIKSLQNLSRRNVIGPWINGPGERHRHSDSSVLRGTAANRTAAGETVRHNSADKIVISNNNGRSDNNDVATAAASVDVQEPEITINQQQQRSRQQTISVSNDSSGEWEMNVQQLIRHNQVTLAILQKQLHDTTNAHRRRSHHMIDSHTSSTNHAHATSRGGGLKEGVGPLAMLNTKFKNKDSLSKQRPAV